MSMFASFQNMPIKRKLMLISLLTSAFALFSISLILATRGWGEWRERSVSDVTTYANIVGTNAAPALLFDDRNAAAETLSALAASPDIVDAVVYDRAGKAFARFSVSQHPLGAPMPVLKPGAYFFSLNQLVVSAPIRFKGEELGTIYLESDLRGFYADILRDTALTFAAALGVFMVSVFLFARLQKTIVAPIMELADGMRKVSAEQDYAVRVAVHGNDEVGVLAGAFNDMLGQIQSRDTEVQERTRQLLAAQDELVRKEKLAVLGQVAGSVGHELRNPLGVMNNAVYFLQTVLTDADETTREYLDIIKGEIALADRIVSDLLDSVRINPPQPETVHVAELFDQVLRNYTVPPSVAVRLDIPAMLPPLRADPLQIQQVLRNLISNGVEAMPDGGILEIRAVENAQAGTVTVSVRDSGSGMTPEQLGHLFQPLFTTKARGIGLGLVVVKNLTQANGGSIKVQSEAGKGSTFLVTLPAGSDIVETA